jgi:hypothetical protein
MVYLPRSFYVDGYAFRCTFVANLAIKCGIVLNACKDDPSHLDLAAASEQEQFW